MTMPEPIFFLGGQDLEMVAIRDLLERHAPERFHDRKLTWGAKASQYRDEIGDALQNDQNVVLIELEDDLQLKDGPHCDRVRLVDHHNELAGFDRPAAIEEVFKLLELPASEWSRELALIAANDRGHCHAMHRVHATRDEMEEIRRRDRLAQGITAEEEDAGRRAAAAAWTWEDGRLTVVRLPHTHTATVTDVMDEHLGGPGYENLLVLCPDFTMMFAPGRSIEALSLLHPDSFCGGGLPHYGFWGRPSALSESELQQIAQLVHADWIRPATQIHVPSYRQILIWPLLLKGPVDRRMPPDQENDEQTGGEKPVDDQLKPWIDMLTGAAHNAKRPWYEVSTLPEPPPPDDFQKSPPELANGPTYEEIVYFHPFVRDFLYGDGNQDEQRSARALRCLRRDDITGVDVQTVDAQTGDQSIWRLQVDRLELYLCKPLVALLVVEVALPDGTEMKLNEALSLQSQFRQVYPPYFDDNDRGGNCPRKVTWLDSRGDAVAESDFDAGRRAYAQFAHQGAEPPVSRHWQELLAPLKPCQKNETSGLFYQQIVDDRIPSMTYLAVDDPRAISEGDFDRLTFCDIGGTAPFPFAAEFLAAGRERHRYDRFWRRAPDQDGADYELTTRYLNSGYQFVVVGRHSNRFFRTLIPTHFRRHYFRMGLIVHYSRAALLKFSEEMSEAIKTLRDVRYAHEFDAPVFRGHVFYIQQTFLKFRSRSWFSEVSNQLLGGEMYQQWSEISRLGELFREVDESSQRLYEALAEHENRKLARSQERLANAAQVIAVIGVVLGIIGIVLAWISV